MVGPGNPPRRNPPRAATHSASPRHRLVALATRTSGRCATLTPEAQNAAVMLAGSMRRSAQRTRDELACRLKTPHTVAAAGGWILDSDRQHAGCGLGPLALNRMAPRRTLLALTIIPAASHAQAPWPARPIRIIHP